jgi:hypothetical protein
VPKIKRHEKSTHANSTLATDGPGSPVFAIRESATGDISLADGSTTSTGIVWSYPRGGGYLSTPVVYRGLLYVLNYNGVLSVYDAKTGDRRARWRRRPSRKD